MTKFHTPRLLLFMQSLPFMFWVAIFTTILLSPNTYFVYYSISQFVSPWREGFSGGVALVLAASIMFYTLRGNIKMASYFAYFEMSISAYYYITWIGLDWALFPALAFTLMLPTSLKWYAKDAIELQAKEEVAEVATPEPLVVVRPPNEKELNEIMDKHPNFEPPVDWVGPAADWVKTEFPG